jgi:hypothetical protein
MKRNLRKQLTELLKELHLPMFASCAAPCTGWVICPICGTCGRFFRSSRPWRPLF